MNRSFALFFLVLCVSCKDSNEHLSSEDSVLNTTVAPRWAEGFDFYENENEEGVILYDLINGGAELSRWAHLKENGTAKDGVNYLDSELKIAAQSTTQMAMIEAIGALDELLCVAYLDYVKSSAIKKRAGDGRLQDISGVGEIDFEKLVHCAPDLMLIYPFGYEGEEMFSKAGVAAIPISEYLEPHPLGRSEWVKVMGWLLNKEAKATSVFDDLENKYVAIVKAKNEHGPKVFTGSFSGGNWYAPGGRTFMARFIEDAGGVYLFEDQNVNENITLPFEALYTKALEADFWSKVVYEKGDLTLEQLKAQDDRFAQLPCFKNSHVFYCNAAETDYFGVGVMEPHLILGDLIHLLNEDDYEAYFFKPVEK